MAVQYLKHTSLADNGVTMGMSIYMLGKIHNLAGIGMNRDCPRKGSRGAVLRTTRNVRALARVMFFLHQVVSGPEGHQVSIVCWCWD